MFLLAKQICMNTKAQAELKDRYRLTICKGQIRYHLKSMNTYKVHAGFVLILHNLFYPSPLLFAFSFSNTMRPFLFVQCRMEGLFLSTHHLWNSNPTLKVKKDIVVGHMTLQTMCVCDIISQSDLEQKLLFSEFMEEV